MERYQKTKKLKRLRSHINSLIYFIKGCLLDMSKPITCNYLQNVYRSLSYLFISSTDASFFYGVIYFNPYVYWISNGALQYIEPLGSGSQAHVVKAYNLSDPSQFYAVKIFKEPKRCEQEEIIMHRIQNELTDNLNIPRIFAKNCRETNAILMQYINAKSLFKTTLTSHQALDMMQQLTTIIIKLGEIGIGHFDIHEGNILKDVNGNYLAD